MSSYESFGSTLDDELNDVDINSEKKEKTSSTGRIALLKSVGKKLLLNRDFHQALLLGQGLSLLLCGTGIFSGLLQEQNFTFPVTQSFPVYILLGVVFTTQLAFRQGDRNFFNILRRDGWKYALLGIIDVEANYLVVKAYEFTTVTSVQILDCFSLAAVLVLSRIFLKTKYRLSHYVGVIVCVLGLAGLVVSDVLSGNNGDSGGSNLPLGDVLVVAGAILYGISNVSQEFIVKNFDKTEFLGMLGCFSSVVSGIQLVILERDGLMKMDMASYKVWLPWVAFIVDMFLIYNCMTYVMEKTSATVTNISMLTADFYSLILGIIIFHYTFHPLYFASFVVVIIGVGIYSYQRTRTTSNENDTINSEVKIANDL